MTSTSSKILPFLSIAIAAIFTAIDLFTDYTITQEMINLLVLVLPVTAAGGVIKKGFEIFQQNRNE